MFEFAVQDRVFREAKAKPLTRAALQSAKLKKPPAKDKKSQVMPKAKSRRRSGQIGACFWGGVIKDVLRGISWFWYEHAMCRTL